MKTILVVLLLVSSSVFAQNSNPLMDGYYQRDNPLMDGYVQDKEVFGFDTE